MSHKLLNLSFPLPLYFSDIDSVSNVLNFVDFKNKKGKLIIDSFRFRTSLETTWLMYFYESTEACIKFLVK